MAFQAKDGSRHTNIDSMRHANARQMANNPAPSAPGPSAPASDDGQDQGQGETHDIQNEQELAQAFQQFMQEEAQEGGHDPALCAKLAKYFSQFIQEEEQENSGGGYQEGY